MAGLYLRATKSSLGGRAREGLSRVAGGDDTDARVSDVDARIAALEAELGQRNAQLAIVNEIGKALVTQREFHSVIEAVGDRALEALGAKGMTICIIDDTSDDLIFHYWVDEGVRSPQREGVVLGDPLSRESWLPRDRSSS